MSGTLMVGIVVGSESDLDVMSKCTHVLDEYGIGWEIGVMSAHRSGDVVRSYAQQASKRGLRVLIGAAGAAAHLPGVLASITTLPVIGVPLAATPLVPLTLAHPTSQVLAGSQAAYVHADLRDNRGRRHPTHS